MIDDHRFVGLRQWGIDPPMNSPCQVDGCGMLLSEHRALCPSTLIIAGETFPCDMSFPHLPAVAHRNKSAGAVWL